MADSVLRNQARDVYRKMAAEYQEKHNCRWSEACLEIKRRYPEAREAFGAPPARDDQK